MFFWAFWGGLFLVNYYITIHFWGWPRQRLGEAELIDITLKAMQVFGYMLQWLKRTGYNPRIQGSSTFWLNHWPKFHWPYDLQIFPLLTNDNKLVLVASAKKIANLENCHLTHHSTSTPTNPNPNQPQPQPIHASGWAFWDNKAFNNSWLFALGRLQAATTKAGRPKVSGSHKSGDLAAADGKDCLPLRVRPVLLVKKLIFFGLERSWI